MKRIITFMMALLVLCLSLVSVTAFPFAEQAGEPVNEVLKEEVEGMVESMPEMPEIGVEPINVYEEQGVDMFALLIAIAAAAVIMGSHYVKCYKRNKYTYDPGNESPAKALNEIKNAVRAGAGSKAPQTYTPGGTYSAAPTNPAFDANQHMMDEMNRQFNQQAMDFTMDEARKAATPFDHGGYQQGYGINPSDTMAADMNTMMNNDMNNMMNNDMNNMNNMGGMGF